MIEGIGAEPEPRSAYDDAEIIADRIIAATDGKIILGLPLGLGKPARIVNALYKRAAADTSISLEILTALTLERPSAGSDMERRFMEPFAARLYDGWRSLDYVGPLRRGTLPSNIRVSEFFLLAGRWLGSKKVQQAYVSANYTHVVRMLLDRGVNVIAQLVAPGERDGRPIYSLSCNTDITLDLLPRLRARGAPFIFAGEVSRDLPFMGGAAIVDAATFDFMLDRADGEPTLFSAPKQPVSSADHAIGIHAASLVKDGGTIQIGIGALGDALTAALIMRHRAPDLFRATLAALNGGVLPPGCETGAFETGLYAASEMFVDGFMELYQAGILKRPAADGAILHAGFFLGTEKFYSFLRELSETERPLFQMRGISFVNELYGDEDAKRRDRRDARFMNSAMMATLLGAVVSDGVEDGQVVSGVGGQYNFVAQALALDDARSVIALNATRTAKGRRETRIVWSYGHATIPRHLRDVVVTEYGVADLRGQSDRDCIAAMLEITDDAFQGALLRQAKRAGKIEAEYALAGRGMKNTPEAISEALKAARAAGYCAAFPFGSDFTQIELRLLPALSLLKKRASNRWNTARAMGAALLSGARHEAYPAEIARMGFNEATGLRDRISRRLLAWALEQTAGDA